MNRKARSSWLAVVLLALSVATEAQLHIGNDLQISGTATANAGYSASYGDQVRSSHGADFGFGGSFNGSYFSPNFLSFQLQPYYSQSRANSDYQTVSDSSGILGSSRIFAGSRFPGSVSFSKSYNGLSTAGNTNGTDLASSGTGQGFSVAWSALLPNLPTFTASYSMGGGSVDVLGAKQESTNSNHNLNFRSTYSWHGFQTNAGYQRGSQRSQTAAFLTGQGEVESTANHDTLSFAISHKIPLNGGFYANVSRSHFSSTYAGANEGGETADYVNAGANVNPFPKLSMNINTTYSDNLAAGYNQTLSASGIAPTVNLGEGTHSIGLSGGVGYMICRGVSAYANVTHLEQTYFGGNYQSTYFSATLSGNYRKPLFGMLTWSVGAMDNATQNGNSNLGFSSAVNITRRIKAWELAASLDYEQNVQTTWAGYTTSSYRWTTQAIRKLPNHWYWNGTLSGTQSGFTQEAGSGNNSQSVSSGIGNGYFALTGNYSQSAGRSILTSQGLVTVTDPLPGLVTYLVLFNANSYGFSFSAHPKRALTIVSTYSKASSDTSSKLTSSSNDTTYMTAHLDYRFRRLGFVSGYTRMSQGITALNQLPSSVNSYFVGINRWFNLF